MWIKMSMVIARGLGKESRGKREWGFITKSSRKIAEMHLARLRMELSIIKYSHGWPWHKEKEEINEICWWYRGRHFQYSDKILYKERKKIIIQERLLYKSGVVEMWWTTIKKTNKNFSFKLAIYQLMAGTMTCLFG